MADLQDFSITVLAAANINVPRAQIAARVTDSTTGATLADFTGPNALNFPGAISTLSAAQRRDLVEMIAVWLIKTKAGVE